MTVPLKLEGHRFGRLTVRARHPKNDGRGKSQWACVCDCGSEIVVLGASLRSGNTHSCGCLRDEKTKNRNTTHGMNRTRVYRIWCGMLTRCTNSNVPAYVRYGARGINVCERWRSFENFYADMGEPPSAQHSLDRINNDGDYEPGNCRWATHAEQRRNTSFLVCIEFNGEQLCLKDWARKTGIHYETLRERLYVLGWPPEKALTTPARHRYAKNRSSIDPRAKQTSLRP